MADKKNLPSVGGPIQGDGHEDNYPDPKVSKGEFMSIGTFQPLSDKAASVNSKTDFIDSIKK